MPICAYIILKKIITRQLKDCLIMPVRVLYFKIACNVLQAYSNISFIWRLPLIRWTVTPAQYTKAKSIPKIAQIVKTQNVNIKANIAKKAMLIPKKTPRCRLILGDIMIKYTIICAAKIKKIHSLGALNKNFNIIIKRVCISFLCPRGPKAQGCLRFLSPRLFAPSA